MSRPVVSAQTAAFHLEIHLLWRTSPETTETTLSRLQTVAETVVSVGETMASDYLSPAQRLTTSVASLADRDEQSAQKYAEALRQIHLGCYC